MIIYLQVCSLFLLNCYYWEDDDLAGLNFDILIGYIIDFSHWFWVFFITPDQVMYEMYFCSDGAL